MRATVVALVFVVAATSQAAAATPQPASRLILSPRSDAVASGSSARVVVRRLAGAKTRVRLGRRDVTKRFRARGKQLLGRLTRRDRLRFGRNHLIVVASRKGRAKVTQTHAFYLVRRGKFARVKVRRGAPARAQIDIVSGASAVALRRRTRTVRVRLNGRLVKRAAIRTATGTRYAISLSRTHGLRYGVNRLHTRVIEPESGRYALVKRSFRVRRTRPLPAAGLDQGARPGVRVRVGGRGKAARNGRLRYRWKLTGRPKGSRARIRGRTQARPVLVPDKRGRYVLEQRVTERKGAHATAARVGHGSADRVAITAQPPALVSLSANTFDGARGITLGGQNYPNPGGPGTIQLLMVDRAALTLGGPGPSFNTFCCADPGAIGRLTGILAKATLDQLVVISLPPNVVINQLDDFNEALDLIGVDPISANVLNSGQQLVIVGIPTAQKGSGWVMRRSTKPAPGQTLGWLMANGDADDANGFQRLRFQPLSVPFDTRLTSTSTSNKMNIGGTTVTAPDDTNPQPGQGGFHVVEVDARDLSVVNNKSYTTNDFAGGESQFSLQAMTDLINGARNRSNYVAVQSIGKAGLTDYNGPGWSRVAEALSNMGANPHLFMELNAATPNVSYAFAGGPPLTRGEVEQSNEGGVVGHARMRPDGLFGLRPQASAATGSLFDALLQPPEAWPFTPGGGPAGTDYAASARAINYITKCLPGLGRWAPDIRQAYSGQSDADWDTASANLGHIYYPGKAPSSDKLALNCAVPVPFKVPEPLFDAVLRRLNNEFGMLARSQKLITLLKGGFYESGDLEKPFLSNTGEQIKGSLTLPNTEVVSPVLEMLATIAEFGEEVVGPEIEVGLDLAAEAYDMSTATSSDVNGKPVDQRVSEEVDSLANDLQTNIGNASLALDNILTVAGSDPGRLERLDSIASGPVPKPEDLADNLTRGAKRYFTTALLPVAFDVWSLASAPGGGSRPGQANPTPSTCFDSFGDAYTPNFTGAPADDSVPFHYPYSQGSLMMVHQVGAVAQFPPASVTSPMFVPVPQSGYGVDKSTFYWQLGNPVKKYSCYVKK